MTDATAQQIASLRSQATIKRGAALIALAAGDDLQAAALHLEAQTYEGAADELAKTDQQAGTTHDAAGT